jgi:hypothetical protein
MLSLRHQNAWTSLNKSTFFLSALRHEIEAESHSKTKHLSAKIPRMRTHIHTDANIFCHAHAHLSLSKPSAAFKKFTAFSEKSQAHILRGCTHLKISM